MVWHIFRKDWKLLWPLVAAVAALHVMNATIWLMVGHFDGSPGRPLLLPIAVLLAMAALIVMSVHQDAVPGDRQDWLVRPIWRRDLILAKLVFVLIAVHGPMLLVDLAQGMATGFGFSASLASALSRGEFLLLSLSVPVLALAAMTSSVAEFIGGALVVGLTYVGITIAIQLRLGLGDLLSGAAHGGMSWMQPAFWSAVVLAAAIAVICLQYFRRATMLARGIALGAVLLALGVLTFVPWTTLFGVQKWLSPDPAAARAVAVTFDPSIGKIVTEPGGLVKIDSLSGSITVARRANSVWLPVRVSGLAPESLVVTDRAEVRIIGADGAILYRGRTTGDPQATDNPGNNAANPLNDFPVRPLTGGDVRTHQLVTLPDKIYELTRSQPVRMELDYSLTLLRLKAADTIAALNGNKRMANKGWCKTKVDYNYGLIEMGCLNPGVDGIRRGTNCFTAVLENPISGQQNPAHSLCYLDYTPYEKFIPRYIPSAVDQSIMRLNFRDPQGLTQFPVGGSQLADAQVVYKSFQPVAHFTRHLVIPEIRLAEWEAETDRAGDP